MNTRFVELCVNKGYRHEFSTPRTPQQNGVVERKNRTLQEMARSMINEHNIPKYLWAEAVNAASYIVNRVSIRQILRKLHMNCGKIANQALHILECLVLSVLY